MIACHDFNFYFFNDYIQHLCIYLFAIFVSVLVKHTNLVSIIFNIFSLMFISFWEREREREWEREREGERERVREWGKQRIQNRLYTESRDPNVGPKLKNCKIMTRAKVRYLTDWATQVPLVPIFKLDFLLIVGI